MGTLQSDGGLAISRAALPTSAFSPFPYPPSLPLPSFPSATHLTFPHCSFLPFSSPASFPLSTRLSSPSLLSPLSSALFSLFNRFSFPQKVPFSGPCPPLPFFSLPNLFHLSLRLLSTIGFLLRHKPRSPRRLVSSLSLPSRNLQI